MTVKSPLRWALLAVSALVLLTVVVFGVSRGLAGDTVLGNVEVLGTQVGGMSPDELDVALEQAAADLSGRPVPFAITGTTVSLEPAQVGLDFDLESMASEALAVGRDGGISTQFLSWLGHWGDSVVIAPRATVDDDLVEAVLESWDDQVIENPPTSGGIAIDGTIVTAVYPVDGDRIDRDVASAIIVDTLTSPDLPPDPVELPVATVESPVDAAAVDAAVATADLWLSAPVTLVAETGDVRITLGVDDLAAALTSTAVGSRIELSFDPDAIEPILRQHASGLEQPPVDAHFEPDGVDIRIVPGHNGTLIDAQATATELAAAAASASRIGDLPFEDGAEPEVTTADLEALGVDRLVSQFTTYHDCCMNRVQNIHLIADAVDGSIVGPGEEFSLNETVGERTTEKGYLEDGSIVGGEIVATVGGGVSQFATTFYNTVFWGGYADVTHRPHSYYFSRYPMGIEATISWPNPELTFRNDSESAVYIHTSYTDTSITVSFYGDNDGRTVIADWGDGGPVDLEVVSEGGDRARRVEATVSDPFAFTDPSTEYEENASLSVDEQKIVQSGRQGWSVKVTRTITVGGDANEESWNVVYRARPEIVEVHPCNMPDSTEECPEPTTTTTSTTTTSTTTTVPAESTTTVAETPAGSGE